MEPSTLTTGLIAAAALFVVTRTEDAPLLQAPPVPLPASNANAPVEEGEPGSKG